jgi:Winged helix-turn-helix DNA-binding
VERTEGRGVADLAEALVSLRFPGEVARPDRDGVDLIATLPDGTAIPFEIKAYKTVTPDTVARLVETQLPQGVTGVVVADYVTPAARDALADAGWGWLDRRGHLGLRAGSLIIDSPVTPLIEPAGQPGARAVEAGVSLDVAVALLANPDGEHSIRDLASYTGRSVGAVHRAIRRMTNEGLIDRGRPLHHELFWEAADRWRPQRVGLAEAPRPGDAQRTEQLHLGLDDITGGVGWAVTDAIAANLYGAPAPVRGDEPPDFYVPDSRTVRVARSLYGEPINAELRSATVAVPPVQWVCEHRVDPVELGRQHPRLEFGFVHPVVAALDLAADLSRGREILEQWTPPPPYVRVW